VIAGREDLTVNVCSGGTFAADTPRELLDAGKVRIGAGHRRAP
jgi:hypothetical protein